MNILQIPNLVNFQEPHVNFMEPITMHYTNARGHAECFKGEVHAVGYGPSGELFVILPEGEIIQQNDIVAMYDKVN